MSTRPQFNPYQVLPNAAGQPANSGDMTLPLISAPTIIQKLSMITYQCNWNGVAPVGNIALETCNDFSLNADGSVKNAGNWNQVPLSFAGATVMAVPVTGNAGTGTIDIDALGAYAIRLTYTPTSGTGQLQIIINAKVA